MRKKSVITFIDIIYFDSHLVLSLESSNKLTICVRNPTSACTNEAKIKQNK